ncbi:MAG: gliding motility-associated protein GldE [Bacteroidales bacterium]
MNLIFLSFFSSAAITVYPVGLSAGIEIIVILLLLIVSGLVSGSEAAFFSLTPSEIKKIEKGNDSRHKTAAGLLHKSENLLATLLLANNFVNIAIVITSSFLLSDLFDFGSNTVLLFLFQVVLITFVILLFGEMMPKILATSQAYRFVVMLAIPLQIICYILSPITALLVKSSSLFRKQIRSKHGSLSLDDLSQALELTSSGLSEEKQLLEGIVRFGNIDVREIMKPRLDIVAADIRTPFSGIIKIINESGYSRIPVYDKTLDNIRGILFSKDLLPHIGKNDSFRWQSLLRPQYYVPETKKISDLLHDFQRNKIHMAIVIDEYGGTSGLVTLEDILEEIIGDIVDESDEESPPDYVKISDNEYVFSGKILLHDFCRITSTSMAEFDAVKGEADTLAGLILEIRGELPAKGTELTYGRFHFVIESADDRKINSVRVTINP